jgi:pyruvate,water dikinase
MEEAGDDDPSGALLPHAVRDALAAAYALLPPSTEGGEARVAVRSSAVDEDGPVASFAGQHETYLNIVGVADLSRAVIRCWRSLAAPRAVAYRRQHGLAIEATRLAVLVQQLVPADTSAIAFSANPASGSREEAVVTATWGLGEGLVGGTVTPDTWIVRKRDAAMLTAEPGDKRVMTVLVPGGTAEMAMPASLRERPALEDAQVRAVTRQGGTRDP